MKEVVKHRLFSFDVNEEKRIIKLTWTEETANMVDQDFEDCLIQFAELANEYKTPNLWVDSHKLMHQFGDGVLEWRKENIIPAYRKAGVMKEAFEVGVGEVKMPLIVTDTGQRTES